MTIVAWDYVLDWLAWRYPAMQSILKSPSMKLISVIKRTLEP
jgi:hypothetical protein